MVAPQNSAEPFRNLYDTLPFAKLGAESKKEEDLHIATQRVARVHCHAVTMYPQIW